MAGWMPASRLVALAVAAVLVLGLAGCGNSGPAAHGARSGQRTLTIYADLPLRGPQFGETQAMVQAMRLVLQDRGDAAGDYSVRLRTLDDADPATGRWSPVRCAADARLVARDLSAVGVIGTYDSGCTRVELPILNRAGVAMISPVNTYTGLTQPYQPGEPGRYRPSGHRTFVRVSPPDALQGGAAVALARALDVHQLYIVNDGRPYGQGLVSAALASAAASGLDIQRSQLVQGPAGRGATVAEDRRLWLAIERSGADAVFYAGDMDDAPGGFWRARPAVLREVRIIAPDALFRDAFLQSTGTAAEGTYVLFGSVPADRLSDQGKAFASEYASRYGQPGTYTLYAAESAGVLLDAIGRSDGHRRSVVHELLGTRFYDGLLGRWSFDANGDTTLRRFTDLVVDGGRFRFDRVLDLSDEG
jgi:branched-chain amino acid transport system substrate-binding protein